MAVKQEIPEHKLRKRSAAELPFKIEAIEVDGGYNPLAPHRHNYFEIFLFETGGGLHMIDFKELSIKSSQVHVLLPSQIHYVKRDPSCSGWVLKFTPEFLQHSSGEMATNKFLFLQGAATSPFIDLDKSQYQQFEFLFNKILEEWQLKKRGFNEAIRSYLELVLVQCDRLFDYSVSNFATEDKLLIKGFKEVLKRNYTTQHKVSFYAEKLKVTEDKLVRVLKKNLGKSVHDLITQQLNLESKRLLLHSDLSIKEIAYKLGFHDNSYYNRWFKKQNNLSPSEFRTNARKKYHT